MIFQNRHAGTPTAGTGRRPPGRRGLRLRLRRGLHGPTPGLSLRYFGTLVAAAGAFLLVTACAGPSSSAGTAGAAATGAAGVTGVTGVTGAAGVTKVTGVTGVTGVTAKLAAATAVPRCTENELIAGLHGYESGGQGGYAQGGFILTLTNNSQDSCSLYGYPGLGLENARHHVQRSDVHWGATIFAPDPGRQLIVLSPR